MDNENIDQEQVVDDIPVNQSGCKVCGNQDVEQNYQFELCTECREELRKRPFPILIKVSFAIIIAILIVALFRFPSTVQAGIAFEKGISAEREGKYVTAVKEYKNVTERFPDSTLALGRLFVATYNNGMVSEAEELFKKISGRNPSNGELVNEVNSTIERLWNLYYISYEADELYKKIPNNDPKELIKLLREHLQKYPDEVQTSYYYSNLLYDEGNFDEAEKVMEGIIATNSDFYEGQLFLAAIYREKGKFEKAKECCNIVIRHNSEYCYGYSSLAKVELKQHNDVKGLELAQKAYELDKNNSNIVATLAIAYHYNNMIEERDEMFNKFVQFNDNNTYDLSLMKGIFSGQNKWR